MIDGFIAIWKEQGYTSHDVVARMRGILKQKKIGHSGTLDPMAEGILLVGLGIGTRGCDLLPDKRKTYRTRILFGKATDTQDIWGNVTEEREVSVMAGEFEKALLSFLGTSFQVPPMYSAKKIGGQKLYDLARKGIIVERPAVPVTIYRIEILNVSQEYADFIVECSEGTYIRTLCEDIGKRLGIPACMSRLERISACGFGEKQAITLSDLEKARDEEKLDTYVIPVDQVLDYPAVTVKNCYTKQLVNGNAFFADMILETMPQDDLYYRVYLENTGFIGIYTWSEEKECFCPKKIFRQEAAERK